MGFTRQPTETFSIHDPAQKRVWIFDVSFMLSGYTCTYGNGCKGTHLTADHGCCAIGAHYYNEADKEKVEWVVANLPDAAFTNAAEIRKKHVVQFSKSKEETEYKTRVLNGKCIFANDASHPMGAGCSLHQAAMLAGDGENHIDWKPLICSWVPMNIVDIEEGEYEGEPDVYFIGRFENEDWADGEQTLEWYCLDDVDNFGNHVPLFRRMQREIHSMLGEDTSLLNQLNTFLDNRWEAERILVEKYPTKEVRVEIGRKPPIAYGTTDGSQVPELAAD